MSKPCWAASRVASLGSNSFASLRYMNKTLLTAGGIEVDVCIVTLDNISP
jgi:hypothetical protein